MTNLPTVEEVRAFFAELNRERVRLGLDEIDTLDFDDAEPDSLYNCLSARNCYVVADTAAQVFAETVRIEKRTREIPEDILRVTDYFDYCDCAPDNLESLREVFVEAGIVKDDER